MNCFYKFKMSANAQKGYFKALMLIAERDTLRVGGDSIFLIVNGTFNRHRAFAPIINCLFSGPLPPRCHLCVLVDIPFIQNTNSGILGVRTCKFFHKFHKLCPNKGDKVGFDLTLAIRDCVVQFELLHRHGNWQKNLRIPHKSLLSGYI